MMELNEMESPDDDSFNDDDADLRVTVRVTDREKERQGSSILQYYDFMSKWMD